MQNLIQEILRLKSERDAVILAHFYQPPEIQEIADFVGDSLELSKKAAGCDAKTIVFCGVYFMAESAKILAPQKRVLIPAPSAGCPMADMLTAADIDRLRAEHPEAAVVLYVNSSAACKAKADVCCTSTNAVRVARSLPNREILFLPDRNLGRFVAAQCPDKRFFYFDGCCPIHDAVRPADVAAARRAHPDAKFAVHPECRPEIAAAADFIGSTAQIIRYITDSPETEFLIGTENGILHRLSEAAPGKKLWPLKADFICPDMKKIGLDELAACLRDLSGEVTLDADTVAAAQNSLQRMIQL